MAQVVARQPYVLDNSGEKSRPNFQTFLEPDTNAGGTPIGQYVQEENQRRLHIPTATGPPDFQTTCCRVETPKSDHEDHQLMLNAKKPYEMAIVDPISSFLSPAGEVLLNTGKTIITTLGKSKIEPQTMIPERVHSIRSNKEAIDEIRRETFGEVNPKLYWNSRKIPDAIIRARLGGWTSEYDARKLNPDPNIVHHKIEDIFPNMKAGCASTKERDELAKKFQYTSSTQAAYEEVQWDKKLPSRLHAPTTTFENGRPDPLKKNDELLQHPQIWQTTAGKAWDRLQERQSRYIREPVAFTQQTRRGNQIPGYGGYIGGYNIEGIDDVIEKFDPYTVLRTQQPKLPDPNFKPNIPGYTGHTHNFKITHVSHYDKEGRPYTTYAAYHRQLPKVDQNYPKLNSLSGDLTLLQTKVPPNNPFNLIKRVADPDTNHSLDHESHPTTISKNRNDAEFLSTKREKEIRQREAAAAAAAANS